MEQQTYADRKSRLVNHRAESRVPEWRSVGSITIHAPELPHPIELCDAGYVVHFVESKMALRTAEIYLRQAYGRTPWWAWSLTIFSAFVLGCIVTAKFFRF